MKILRVVAYMLLALIFCTADSCHNPPKTPVLDHILFYGNTIKSNTSQSYPVFFHGDPNNLEFSQLTQYAEVTAQVADRSYGLGAGGEKLGSGINGGVEFVPDGLYMKLTVYWPFHLLETNPQSVTLRIREHSPDSYYAGTPQEYSDPLIITLTVPIPKAVSATYSTNPFRVDITWD